MFDRTAGQRVALAERAVVVDQNLRHQEQGDAARTGRRIRQLGQYQMDDVVGQVVLATVMKILVPLTL